MSVPQLRGHRTCRKGRNCLCPTGAGGPAHLSVEPYTRIGLCARCYRAQYKRFPWGGDPRDVPGHPDYIGELKANQEHEW